MRIDAHQHFWQYNPVDYSWIDDSMAAIRKDFFPGDLAPLLHRHGFDGCVLVQSEQTEKSNDFLLKMAAKNTFIKGVVAWTDFTAADIREKLALLQQQSAIKGFRHILQGEKDRAFMLREDFLAGIAALNEFNFTYDILIFPDQLPFTESFIQKFPGQKFIIDHLAKPYIKKGEIGEWQAAMEKIAAFPNVYCKLSGMATEADWQQWRKEDFIPYLDVVVNAFGAKRVVYGSDWPVCLVAATYQQQLELVEGYFSSYTASEKAAIFGGNAVQFYQLT
jgi:L-fuconolactonase